MNSGGRLSQKVVGLPVLAMMRVRSNFYVMRVLILFFAIKFSYLTLYLMLFADFAGVHCVSWMKTRVMNSHL